MVSKEKARKLKKKLERLLSPDLEFNKEEFTELVGGKEYYEELMNGEKSFEDTQISKIAYLLTKTGGRRAGSLDHEVIGRDYKTELWNWQCKNLAGLKEDYVSKECSHF